MSWRNIFFVVLISSRLVADPFPFNAHVFAQAIEQASTWNELMPLVMLQTKLAIYLGERVDFREGELFTMHWVKQPTVNWDVGGKFCVNKECRMQKLAFKGQIACKHERVSREFYKEYGVCANRRALDLFLFYLGNEKKYPAAPPRERAEWLLKVCRDLHHFSFDVGGCVVLSKDGKRDAELYAAPFSEIPESNLAYAKALFIAAVYAFNSVLQITFSPAGWGRDLQGKRYVAKVGQDYFPFLQPLTPKQMAWLNQLYQIIFRERRGIAEPQILHEVHLNYDLFEEIRLVACDEACLDCWHGSMVNLFS